MSKSKLFDAYLEDLRTDIRCAERDGLPEYAAECRAQLAELERMAADGAVQFDRYGIPRAAIAKATGEE